VIPNNDRSLSVSRPVRFWVLCQTELLDRADLRWPASWSVTRSDRPANPGTAWIEVADTDAPAEIAGKICEPTVVLNGYPDSAVSVLSYNPVES